MPLYVTVTDGPRRPLPGTRVSIQAGTWIGPVSGVTNAAGKVTLAIKPVPFRPRGLHDQDHRISTTPGAGDEAPARAALLAAATGSLPEQE